MNKKERSRRIKEGIAASLRTATNENTVAETPPPTTHPVQGNWPRVVFVKTETIWSDGRRIVEENTYPNSYNS